MRRKKTVRAGGHTIEIARTFFIGDQRITVDGRVVSEIRSQLDFTAHAFTVREGSADVPYEVDVLSKGFLLGYVIRRNGIVLAHDP